MNTQESDFKKIFGKSMKEVQMEEKKAEEIKSIIKRMKLGEKESKIEAQEIIDSIEEHGIFSPSDWEELKEKVEENV